MKKQLVGIGIGIAASIFGGIGGANATILTTATGLENLEWLEFSSTLGVSRDYVEANVLGSVGYEGYRYASRLETELLLDSYYTNGTGDIHNDFFDAGYNVATYNAANNFMSDFEVTYESTTPDQTEQLVSFYYGSFIEIPTNETFLGRVEAKTSATFSPQGHFNSRWGTDSTAINAITSLTSSQSFITASLLVRNTIAPVPEPATILLFSTGLVGLVSLKLRKKKK